MSNLAEKQLPEQLEMKSWFAKLIDRVLQIFKYQ
jgi:hypothetical protein